MNSPIQSLNSFADLALRSAWPMLWQSSLLIVTLFLLDFALRRKVRAAVRYALWLVLLIKLLLPPSLALPTSIAWWLRPSSPAPVLSLPKPATITYGPMMLPAAPLQFTPPQPVAPPPPTLSFSALILLLASSISLGLFAFILWRWRQILRHIHQTHPSPEWLSDLLEITRSQIGLRHPVRLRLTDQSISPAVCGLFRRLILLPESLVADLPRPQLRAVLLHELVHLRRYDVWINCAQSLLQIAYWWHPLLWFANARIRRLREEAVDDAVMLALRDESEIYAPTLLEVARLAFHRPLASLGLVGILETKRALRKRIERLVDFEAPPRAGTTVVSLLGVLAFTCLAVPQSAAPAKQAATLPEAAPKLAGAEHVSGGTNASELVKLRTKAAALVRNAAVLFEMHKLDEADAKLKEAIRLDPANQEAYYYSNLIREARNHATQNGRTVTSPYNLRDVENGWARPNNYESIRSETISEARQHVLQKLDSLHIEQINFDNMPLSEVVRILSDETRKHDPDGIGLNFILSPNMNSGSFTTIDPASGLPIASPPVEGPDFGTVRVKLASALRDVRLGELLDIIVNSADHPPGTFGIKYSIKDYGVVFSWRPRETVELTIRTFRLDPNTFTQSLERAVDAPSGSLHSTNNARANDPSRLYYDPSDPPSVPRRVVSDTDLNTSSAIRRLFQMRGLDLSPPKALFWDGRQGTLLVRATLQDLDTIEKTIAVLSTTPPQINIKATFVSLPPNAAPALWKSLGITNKPHNPESIVLSSTQAIAALKAIKLQKGMEILAESQVLTLAGRQAQIQVANEQTIVTGVTNGSKEPTFLTENVMLGPVLDVTPNFVPDSFAVQLKTVATVNEFLGYDDPKNETTEVLVGGKPTRVKAPHPRFRTTQILTNLTVLDGQTLVLGNATPAEQVSGKVVKPLPKLEATRKSLLVFVTPTLVDAAGNVYPPKDGRPPASK
jgi:beta-lactamase regulating signal transducer with metallopeptidase domain/type II secretory pathway component GspD/PulD (secretin)